MTMTMHALHPAGQWVRWSPQRQMVWARNGPSHRPKSSVFLCRSKPNDDSPDIIESFVGMLFGKNALEDRSPFGMKRISTPEMYPATTDEFAPPLEGDSPEVAQYVRPLLAATQLESLPLRLAYDANRDGWSTEAFYDRVNTFGAGLVIMKTVGGAIIGGYNPRGWIGLGEDRDSIAAFLFTWPLDEPAGNPIKLPKVGGPSLAVIDNPSAGIQFGAEGLKTLVPGRERQVKCRLGTFYAKMPDGGRSIFALSENPKVTELEELRCYVAQGSGEAWNLDGIIWKTEQKL